MKRPSAAIRPLLAVLMIACMTAAPAVAQDNGTLPDPDDAVAVKQDRRDNGGGSGALPTTGVPALALVAAGAWLLAAGVALLPTPRRRRTYATARWRTMVAVAQPAERLSENRRNGNVASGGNRQPSA